MNILQILGASLMVLGIIGVFIFGLIYGKTWADKWYKLFQCSIWVYVVGWIMSWGLLILN